MKTGAFEFKLTRRVDFSDTDMAGIMHFSNFFRFMEAAEQAFFRSLGFSIYDTRRHPGIGWPVFTQPVIFVIPSVSKTWSRYTCRWWKSGNAPWPTPSPFGR